MTLRAAAVRRLLGCDPPATPDVARRFRVRLFLAARDGGRGRYVGELVPARTIGSWTWESLGGAPTPWVPSGSYWESVAFPGDWHRTVAVR